MTNLELSKATVGTQTTMPVGTPDDVRRVVRGRIEKPGHDGGHSLAPMHVPEPEVPVVNIIAFIEATAGCCLGGSR